MEQSAGSRSESDDISVSGAGERPPAAKKMKQCGPTSVELKPDVKSTFHPSGPKFLNVWLWKHYKLSPRANCDKWALCALCLSSTWLFQIPVRPLREYSHRSWNEKDGAWMDIFLRCYENFNV